MKRIIRTAALEIGTIYIASQIAEGIIFEEGLKTLLFAGLALTAVSLFAKPAIKILLLPLNLVTFGLFRWVSNVIALYLVILIVPSFKIAQFSYPGLDNQFMTLPQVTLAGFWGVVAFALLISTINSFFHWLVK